MSGTTREVRPDAFPEQLSHVEHGEPLVDPLEAEVREEHLPDVEHAHAGRLVPVTELECFPGIGRLVDLCSAWSRRRAGRGTGLYPAMVPSARWTVSSIVHPSLT